MTGETKKTTEPPLKLDMSFGELLTRALQTDPKEVDESIQRSKTKKPPQDAAPRRPAPPIGCQRKPTGG
jgi:hypothetical protein